MLRTRPPPSVESFFDVISPNKHPVLSASTSSSVVWQKLVGSSQILDLSATVPFFAGFGGPEIDVGG